MHEPAFTRWAKLGAPLALGQGAAGRGEAWASRGAACCAPTGSF